MNYTKCYVTGTMPDNDGHPMYCVELECEDGTSFAVLTRRELEDIAAGGVSVHYEC